MKGKVSSLHARFLQALSPFLKYSILVLLTNNYYCHAGYWFSKTVCLNFSIRTYVILQFFIFASLHREFQHARDYSDTEPTGLYLLKVNYGNTEIIVKFGPT